MDMMDKKRGKIKTIIVKWFFMGFFTSITLLIIIILYILEVL